VLGCANTAAEPMHAARTLAALGAYTRIGHTLARMLRHIDAMCCPASHCPFSRCCPRRNAPKCSQVLLLPPAALSNIGYNVSLAD
jgi:hypothetical protein